MKIVKVTLHAVERLRLRYPVDYAHIDSTRLRRFVSGEVVEAIDAGRMATRMPKWAVRPGTIERSRGRRGRGERDRTIRFVWTASEGRVYVVDRTKRLTTVLTVIRPQAADTDVDVDAA